MNKHALRLPVALIIGFIPLFCKLPYIFRSWNISPLDRPGRIFAILFLITLAVNLPLAWRRCQSWDYRSFPALLLGGSVFFAGWFRDIHGLMILGAIALAWSTIWLAVNWNGAYALLPSFIVLVLATPSMRYWLGYFSGATPGDGLLPMSAAAMAAIAWMIATQFTKRTPPCETFCFAAATLAVLASVAMLNWTGFQTKTPAFIPDFASLTVGEYLGRELEATASDRAFFGDNEIKKYYFASEQAGIVVLAVECGEDVHQIHPASHCLRSSGWTIITEKTVPMKINDREFAVNEIVASHQAKQSLIWVWYSNRQFSTGDFLLFRQSWRRSEAWHSYQLLTPLAGSPELARQNLSKLLQAAPMMPAKQSRH